MFGWLAGQVMAHRASNIDRNLWTVSLLSLKTGDTVLEIGFGPGIAIQSIVQNNADIKVIGLDHSRVMLNAAAKRNSQYIDQKQLELILGSVERVSNLPYQFDKIFTVNCHMFWDHPEIQLRNIHSKMKPGGLIAITHQPRNQGANHQDTAKSGNQIMELLEKTGFKNPTRHIKPLKPVNAVCITAHT